MNKFAQFELSGGGSLPTIAFGTGTTFFDRGGEVADVVVKGIRSGYRVRKRNREERNCMEKKHNKFQIIITNEITIAAHRHCPAIQDRERRGRRD